MTGLLVLTALLLLASGLVKLRAGTRVGMGLPLLSLLEVLAGLAVAGALVASPPSASAGLWIVVGGVVLVLVSSVRLGVVLRRHSRHRELSEGARLRTYVTYLSGSPDPGGDVPPPADRTP